MATTAERLAFVRAEREARLLAEEIYDAGFDDAEDYATWNELEQLRRITMQERLEASRSSVNVRPGSTGSANGIALALRNPPMGTK